MIQVDQIRGATNSGLNRQFQANHKCKEILNDFNLINTFCLIKWKK